jgi:hypothetical protein
VDAILHILRSLAGSLLRQWPDLIGTFYGVLLGGLATLGIVRWQLAEERRSRERLDKEFLAGLVEHVNREIAKNLRTLRDLVAAAGQSRHARLDLWDWMATIVGSFTSQAHDDLYRTGLQHYLPSQIEEEIRNAHSIVFDVRHRVRQVRAQHIFNTAYSGDDEANDLLFDEVKSLLPGWLAGLEQADRVVAPRRLPWVQAAAAPRKARVRRRGVLGGGLRKIARFRRRARS